ncbi:MAG TPA: hypothetical protein VMT71_00600 [Syntrophorhabdales bacterium]|nr:hypothetical protein [Syntrophorhabdales bacterium]
MKGVMQIAVDRLIETSEPMRQIWLDFYGEWSNDKKGLPYLVLMTSFAGYMVNLYLGKHLDVLQRILDAIEELYCNEGAEVDTLLTAGLLEDIQLFLKDENVPLSSFMALLGDRSKGRWEAARAYLEEGKPVTYESA